MKLFFVFIHLQTSARFAEFSFSYRTKNGFKSIDSLQTIIGKQSSAVASWAESRVFHGDLAEVIRELKAGPGKPIITLRCGIHAEPDSNRSN